MIDIIEPDFNFSNKPLNRFKTEEIDSENNEEKQNARDMNMTNNEEKQNATDMNMTNKESNNINKVNSKEDEISKSGLDSEENIIQSITKKLSQKESKFSRASKGFPSVTERWVVLCLCILLQVVV